VNLSADATASAVSKPAADAAFPHRRRPGFLAAGLIALPALTLPGVIGYAWQLRDGLGVTGLQQPVFWGVYTVNFVFFIGIAHAGTLISAVLRLVGAAWQRPIVRIAEATTLIMLVLGGGQLLLDVGRPMRAPILMLLDGRFESPLLWDMTCILAYLYASTLYLYVSLIPDLARLRDGARGGSAWWVYGVLALDWCGTPRQERCLARVTAVMAILVVPIAISVHSVIAFIFAMTLQPLWHSTILAPYFVVGAIYSGVAAILLILVIGWCVFGLKDRVPMDALRRLSRLLLGLAMIWAYFTLVEHLTVLYGGVPDEMAALWNRLSGGMSGPFWFMVVLNFVLPLVCLSYLGRGPLGRMAMAAGAVLIGMWLERYLIVVPTLLEPRLGLPTAAYSPSWVEWAVLVASLALFGLAFWTLARVLPLLPLTPERRRGPLNPARDRLSAPGSAEEGAWVGTPRMRWAQWMIPGVAVLFSGAVVVWLGRLALGALSAGGAPLAAIAVTAVAIPVFLGLLGVTLCLFAGLRGG